MSSEPVKKPESSMHHDVVITTTEMHTGGEPVRIIESGYPVPQGETILDKIEDLRKNYDEFRKFLILEPRGHYDMYGVLLVAPDNPDADIAAIFLHNEGYSTMCGHACIALGRYAVDRGLVSRDSVSPETRVNIQVPCGLVTAYVKVSHDDVRKYVTVRFENVPSFVVCKDVDILVKTIGTVKVDVAYGGAFYVFVTAEDLGLSLETSPLADIVKAATALKAATIDIVPLSHPETPAFLYGTMIVDSRHTLHESSTNLCVFADQEVDRSPCGSGTAARVALMYHRGLLGLGQGHIFKSRVTGSEFKAKVTRATKVEEKDAVVVEVEGQSFYTGHVTMTLEAGDVLGRGFIAR
ncbi:unnamed protein product [Lymnaea stagnalis]|uniref:trans-L-3-hydroxyproline dehydratase n=1 Tax=Lymnaea stagnalis TaxID=6523 RepID=A0AAV2H2T1_LYMST